MTELSLVIPFFNEEDNLPVYLSQLASFFDLKKVSYEIIAVDNGSSDRTGEILASVALSNKRVKVVTVKANRGYGFGILSGSVAAAGKYIGYSGGDGQILPEDVYRVYSVLRKEDLDICKVKRVSREDGFFRRAESSVFNAIFCFLFSLNLKDINGSPKIMKAEVFRSLKPSSKDWFLDAELMIKAFRKNFKIKELPVVFRKRRKGKSNVRLTTAFEFVKNAAIFKLRGY